MSHIISKKSLLKFGFWSIHLVWRFRKSLNSLICWLSGAKRSLIFTVIDKLRFSRSTFETAEKNGKSSPKSITVFDFVIVFVFFTCNDAFFLHDVSEIDLYYVKLMNRISYYEIYNGWNWRMVRECCTVACDCNSYKVHKRN